MSAPAAFAPLVENAVFRGLWVASLAANMAMWMHDVAAAWLMTSLTTNPALVALVSTASAMPVFVLGIPSGALADIVDRRRFFAVTQLWVTVTAVALVALVASGALSAPLLLLLTFANGMALAMRWPVFAAVVPQVVTREHLPQALALNGISMNLSRVAGPMVAGALLSTLGADAVFALNAAAAVLSFGLILRWKSAPRTSTLPGERFVGAVRVGLTFALQSPRLKVILLRIFLFFVQVSALSSLLPLVARGLHGGGPGTFTLMLSALGLGAIVAALMFPRWRARFDRDRFVRTGTLVHAAATSLIVAVPEIWLALPAMFVVGMAWMSVANSLNIAAQVAMPDWVRARGMAIYQTALMGGATAGSLVWGQVAGWIGVNATVWAAAGFALAVLLLTRRLTVEGGRDIDFSPATTPRPLPEPQVPVAPDDGPVMVTIEYQVDPARATEFAEVMQRTRRARLRQGALSWGLFRDVAEPGRYIEYFVDETWIEHLRRLERFTAFDAELRELRLSFHTGSEPPLVRRYVGDAHMPPAEAPPVH
ncbi:MAG: MFS transporter [Rubrivivax sp.]